MKITLVTIITLVLLAGTIQAQPPVNIGIKGGLNLYNISGDDDGSNDMKTSFHVGLLGHIHVADNLALQPEIVYSSQGTKYGDDVDLNLNYINVPFLFQYMFDNGFRIQAGPQVGILVSAKNDGEDIKDDLKSVDFGVGLGASYVHPPSGFGIDARYNHGISNINENEDFKSYNRGFQVGVFYLFKHKS